MMGERECGGYTHFADAERIEKTRQRGLLAVLQRGIHIGSGFFTHAFEFRQLWWSEHIKVGGVLDQFSLDQLIHQFVAQILDIQGAA